MKIFDTSSLIAILTEAKCSQVFENCLTQNYSLSIPTTVYNELRCNKVTFEKFRDYEKHFKILDVEEDILYRFLRRYPNLHRGEAGVICIALEKKKNNEKYICIVDDGGARKFCEQKEINLSGLIGFLTWQKKTNYLDKKDCKIIYSRLLNSAFRINKDILCELIK